MKILITGGTGLVGSAINNVRKKMNLGDHKFIFLSSKDCNLTNYDETYKTFSEHKPDIVIHLAASVGGLFKNLKYKVNMLEENMLINHNVLKCSYEFNVEKVISCLSTCIFPDKTSYPINEQMLHDGPPHNSNDTYAYAKRLLEIHSKAYQKQYNKQFICIIPTNIYGPHDNFSLDDGHVIPSLIHRCYLNKNDYVPFKVLGTGKPLRQFIYSEDLAKLILLIMDKYKDKESIILSVEKEVSIGDVAKHIAKNYNYENNILFDVSYSDGQYKKTADNTKLKKFLNKNKINFKFTDIETGIGKTVKWFIDNYEYCRK